MATYNLGSTVKIPLQITINAVAFSGEANPKIRKIILPSGNEEVGFPQSMLTIDQKFGLYYYNYIPNEKGDYIVIFSFEIEDTEYTTIFEFSVYTKDTLRPFS